MKIELAGFHLVPSDNPTSENMASACLPLIARVVAACLPLDATLRVPPSMCKS